MTTFPGAYTVVHMLANGHLHDFAAILTEKNSASPGHMRHAVRDKASSDPSDFAAKIPDAALSLLAPSLVRVRQDVAHRGPQHAGRPVYVMPKVPLGDGHAMALMTFAPLPAATADTVITHPNLMRLVVTAFPGGGAAFTDAQMRQALCCGSWPRNVRRPLPRDVIADNAALYRQDAPLSGIHLLGHNSWSLTQQHLLGSRDTLSWQAAVQTTTPHHSQEGTVLWVVLRLAEYPEGLAWLSVHFGKHPVPLGDTVNTWLAPLLFHPTFHRAMHLAHMLPELTDAYGKEAVAELLLNPAVAQRVHDAERALDPRRHRQNRLLAVMDRTGGLLLNGARWLITAHT